MWPSVPLLTIRSTEPWKSAIYLGRDRVYVTTHRGYLEDLIHLESLDAEAEERLLTMKLSRV